MPDCIIKENIDFSSLIPVWPGQIFLKIIQSWLIMYIDTKIHRISVNCYSDYLTNLKFHFMTVTLYKLQITGFVTY